MVRFLENSRLYLPHYVYAPALQTAAITTHLPLKSLPEPHFLYNFLSFASLTHIFFIPPDTLSHFYFRLSSRICQICSDIYVFSCFLGKII